MKARKGNRFECCGKLLGGNWKACPLCGERVPDVEITDGHKLIFEFDTIRKTSETSARLLNEKINDAELHGLEMDHHPECYSEGGPGTNRCKVCHLKQKVWEWKRAAKSHTNTALKYAWRIRVVEDLIAKASR